jgi:glycosyltransferase involved in cell wall biosynthesis
MTVSVLMITHDRPEYLKLSLERLCASATADTRIFVWDNGSGPETRDILRRYESQPCVERVVYNNSNDLLRIPTNWFWETCRHADLLGKVDDDCLVPENWIDVLEAAHREIPQAGFLACWHFLPQDVVLPLAMRKIQHFGRHQIMRNCWVGGSGYLVKREVLERHGPLRLKDSFTDCCIRAAAGGYVNGWYYPFLYQEHMDDPRAPHTGIRCEEDFQRMIPLTARKFDIRTREQWVKRMVASARRLQEFSYDPKDYVGVRAWLARTAAGVLRSDYFPKAK